MLALFQRNYQFDFLRPQHSLFQYFTKLVEQYTKVSGGFFSLLTISSKCSFYERNAALLFT